MSGEDSRLSDHAHHARSQAHWGRFSNRPYYSPRSGGIRVICSRGHPPSQGFQPSQPKLLRRSRLGGRVDLGRFQTRIE